MHDLSRTALLGLALLSAASRVSAVSLASFTPRINNLPPSCQSVYTTALEGCKAEDFTPGTRCSAGCIQGVVKIAEAVLKGCSTVDVGETSIIGVFQNGFGIQSLCPGVSVITISSSTATSTRAQTQTGAQPATSRTSTTTLVSRASTTSTTLTTPTSQTSQTSQTTEVDSSSTSSNAITTDPKATSANNAPPTTIGQPGGTSRTSSATTEPTRTANSQLSNADSGGGSPFDVTAVGVSGQLRVFDITATAFLATAFLFIVWV